MAFTDLLVMTAVMLTWFMEADGLRCMSCYSTRIAGSGMLSSVSASDTSDEACENPNIIDMNNAHYEECSPWESCLAFKGEATYKILFDSVKYEMTVRGCMAKHSSGCVGKVDEASSVLNNFVKISGSIKAVHGRWCYCNTNACHAGDCGPGSINIFHYCTPWWILVSVGVLFSSLITCCCCCFCCGKSQ